MNQNICKNFIGIDVSRDTLDIFISQNQMHTTCLNTIECSAKENTSSLRIFFAQKQCF